MPACILFDFLHPVLLFDFVIFSLCSTIPLCTGIQNLRVPLIQVAVALSLLKLNLISQWKKLSLSDLCIEFCEPAGLVENLLHFILTCWRVAYGGMIDFLYMRMCDCCGVCAWVLPLVCVYECIRVWGGRGRCMCPISLKFKRTDEEKEFWTTTVWRRTGTTWKWVCIICVDDGV